MLRPDFGNRMVRLLPTVYKDSKFPKPSDVSAILSPAFGECAPAVRCASPANPYKIAYFIFLEHHRSGTLHADGSIAMKVLWAACLFTSILEGAEPSGDQILTAMAQVAAARHAAVYTGWREYSIQNRRFGKTASVKVRIAYRPGAGKQFTIGERSGSPKLISVVESLLASEADASKPGKDRAHEIDPSNYSASIVGAETVAGRDCWIVALTPKSKSKYLLKGAAWVDKKANALVRLDGVTAANVSMWVGAPRVIEDFAPIAGVWLPVHTVSRGTSLWLGESDLDIRYMDYTVVTNTFSSDGRTPFLAARPPGRVVAYR